MYARHLLDLGFPDRKSRQTIVRDALESKMGLYNASRRLDGVEADEVPALALIREPGVDLATRPQGDGPAEAFWAPFVLRLPPHINTAVQC